MGDYKVVITGFNTAQEAEDFVNWYEGAGEQNDIADWMRNSNVSSVLTDMDEYLKQGAGKVNSNKEVILPIKIHYI